MLAPLSPAKVALINQLDEKHYAIFHEIKDLQIRAELKEIEASSDYQTELTKSELEILDILANTKKTALSVPSIQSTLSHRGYPMSRSSIKTHLRKFVVGELISCFHHRYSIKEKGREALGYNLQ